MGIKTINGRTAKSAKAEPIVTTVKTVKVGDDKREMVNTFTVTRVGNEFTETETGEDGFIHTRTVDKVSTNVIRTKNLSVTATPVDPVKRNGWSYRGSVGYTWTYDVKAEVNGVPVELDRVDLVRFANFIAALGVDRYDERVTAF